MPVTEPNPLAQLSDQDLFSTQIMLYLVCNKAKWSLRGKKTKYLCGLNRLLEIEATNRGRPSPVPPIHGSDVPA